MSTNQRLPRGILPYIQEQTGVPARTISDYIAGTKHPGGSRAVALSEEFSKIKIRIPIRFWFKGAGENIRGIILSAYRENGDQINALIGKEIAA